MWATFRDRLYRTNWVVYCKRPFDKHRIVGFADSKVTFTYKDYADGGRRKRRHHATPLPAPPASQTAPVREACGREGMPMPAA